MQIINRGFISISPKQSFWDWANTFETDIEFSESDEVEPNVYLITENFMEIEPIIEKHFKSILKNELSMITENEDDWPQIVSIDVFLDFFSIIVGSTVFDLEKSDLKSEHV